MATVPPTPTIRRALPGDVQALSQIGARTFIDTFGHLYPDQDLQAFLHDNYSPAVSAKLLADDHFAVWLLEQETAQGQQVVGYAVAGSCGLPHAEVQPADGELKRLYLLPALHNGGWGTRMFQVALDWLERDGPRTVWISVWSENLGAQRFYQRHGFGKVGEYEFPVGRVRDREFMFRRLASQRVDPSPAAGPRE